MSMIEQNISGVELEKLRQKAERKTKFMFTLPKIVFVIFVLISLFINRYFFIFILQGYEFSKDSILGGIFMIIGGIMIALCMAAASFGFYYFLSWNKTYNLFNYNYKNKYVLLKMKEVPGFSNLKYSFDKGITFSDIVNANLLPGRTKSFFKSEDYFEGVYDKIRFYSSSVQTYDTSDSSLPLFDGQVIVFSMFHDFKISETPIQIFPKKQSAKMKGLTFPVKIETENETFNNMFCVYAKDAHNAFYILTPKIIEDIIEFAQIINNNIYISFVNEYMYVGCEQIKNPFNAIVDVPLEKQSENILKATEIIQKARDILIHIENK